MKSTLKESGAETHSEEQFLMTEDGEGSNKLSKIGVGEMGVGEVGLTLLYYAHPCTHMPIHVHICHNELYYGLTGSIICELYSLSLIS